MLLYCSWGYVMAAVAKAPQALGDAPGPGGLLPNHAYSVVDCRVLPDGTRLVRVHNPWAAGGWQGAWAAESREWLDHGALAGLPVWIRFAQQSTMQATLMMLIATLRAAVCRVCINVISSCARTYLRQVPATLLMSRAHTQMRLACATC